MPLNIETRQTPRTATDEEKPDQPAKLGQVQRRRRISGGHRADAPRVSEHSGCDTETHHVGKRVELLAEFAIRAHRARHAAIQRIEQNREANCTRGVIEIGYFAVERRQNRIVAA